MNLLEKNDFVNKKEMPKRKNAELWCKQWPSIIQQVKEHYPDIAAHNKKRRLGNLKTQREPAHFRAVELFLKKLMQNLYPARIDVTPNQETLSTMQMIRQIFPASKTMRQMFKQYPNLPVAKELIEILEKPRLLNGEEQKVALLVLERLRKLNRTYRDKEAISICLFCLQTFRDENKFNNVATNQWGNISLLDAVHFCFYGSNTAVNLRINILLATGFNMCNQELLQEKMQEYQKYASLFRSLPTHSSWTILRYFVMIEKIGDIEELLRKKNVNEIMEKFEMLETNEKAMAWKIAQFVLQENVELIDLLTKKISPQIKQTIEQQVRNLSSFHNQVMNELYDYIKPEMSAYPHEHASRLGYCFAKFLVFLNANNIEKDLKNFLQNVSIIELKEILISFLKKIP